MFFHKNFHLKKRISILMQILALFMTMKSLICLNEIQQNQ